MLFSDLKIGPRVALAFGGVVATIVVMAAVVQLGMANIAGQAVEMGDGMRMQAVASETHLLAKENAIASMVMLVSPSAEQQTRLRNEIQGRDGRILKNLQTLEGAGGASEDAALVADIRKRHGTYQGGVQRIADLIQRGKQAEAAYAADEEMIPMLAPFLQALAKLDERQVARVRGTEADSLAHIQQTRWQSAAAGLAAALIALGAGWWVVHSLTKPLARALHFAEEVAAGKLGAHVDVQGHDEVAQLLRALNRMNESLATVVKRVRAAAENIATGSGEIAAGNTDLSQRTELQASTLEETAASMEELGGAVTHNAENARQADELARGASHVAERGGEVVGQVIATMKGIDSSSKRIADIIGVIDGIAFQTNILALNAAVEAARAGEQGRGFAVVAAEVRNLAHRSADAAKEIKALIGASVEQVEAGTSLVDKAGATMQEVVTAINRVSSIMSEINSASSQQNSGVHQIGAAVTQLDHTTQQNAALVEESAAAAESLSRQAQELVHAVAAFNLEHETA
jgi:methyl-accepting chemotaxis protein